MFSQRLLVIVIASLSYGPTLYAETAHNVEEIVVTGVRTESPLNVTTDPKAPRQPVPAQDGADYLKTIPGFSVIRKGGADGDPVFRGMAGSRISMLVDGETVLGGCSNRMDPPTAYIFPEAFDSIQVIKGPQSVQHGPGNAAGVVLFERNQERPEEAGWDLHASALLGSFGRHDEVLDGSIYNPEFSLRVSATNASQNDYRDGDGNRVHSEYHRWNTQAVLAWTPDDDTRMELTLARSDGEAAYADRGVDGSKFARDNVGLKFSKDNLGDFLQSLDAQLYYNYTDHVMDNYSLRDPQGVRSAMNPDRETKGGRITATLIPAPSLEWIVGADQQRDEHSNRMNHHGISYRSMPREEDANFKQTGVFTELHWDLADGRQVISGLRADRWQARDLREQVGGHGGHTMPNPHAGETRKETLRSYFLRLEQNLESINATTYIGVGHNERFPDYWEMIGNTESVDSVSAFEVDAEKLTQLDAGIIYTGDKLSGSFSAFYNEIDDYILIDYRYDKGGRTAKVARNIDARSWGLEMDAQYRFNDHWRAEFTLASVRGANDTDDRTLAQLSPIETRTSLHYQHEDWSVSLLWRFLDSQKRVDIGRGNIAGQDIGESDSFNIFSLNASWRPSDMLLLTGGVDNLLDETYAEHISSAGASIPGFDQTTRVNEPGRTFWMKAQFTF